nr:reverse transcriptase domain-containing protein [Tanacetum cinerariifolium]
MTNLRNEITRFQQRFDESFSEAWDRFNDLLRACPHHGFSELHQLDTFYNALNVNDQDSLNSATGGIFLDKMPSNCLKIIESKSKVRQSRAKAVVAKVNSSSSTPAISSNVAELKDMVRALLLNKKNQSSAPAPSPTPAPVKAVEPNCVTCGGTHSYQNCHATSGNVYQDNIQEYVSQATVAKETQVNQPLSYQAPAYQAPIPQTQSVPQTDFKRYVKANDAVLRNIQSQGQRLGTLPGNTITNPKEDLNGITTRSGVTYQGPTIPTPSKVVKQGTEPVVAPVSAPMPNLKPLIPYPSRRDNERCREQANEQIEKFYKIFKDMSFEISFTDALILIPKFASTLKALIGNKEKLSEMARTPMNEHCSTIVRSLNRSALLKMSKLKLTGRALIDVHKVELTLRIGNEAITYNLDQTSRYSANYDHMTANKIDVTDEACEEYSQDVLDFSDVTTSSSPTPSDDPIVSTTSPMLTSFGDSDFLLFEEANAFLGLEDDPDSLEFDPSYYDPEGDILMLEAILNTKMIKSSVDEPPEVELKDLPPHLEYAFLEGDNKLPVIIARELGDEEKSALIKVLKSHKRAITWKLSDIQGINPKFCTHKILMEEDYKPAVQHQRRVNPKIHDVIKKEVEQLLDAGLIYPISNSSWVSPVHCVPKKGGFTVVKNEENELIPTRMVTGCGRRLFVKMVEAKALPTNDALVVCKFLKSLFARFGAPRAIISDRGTHFFNDQFAKVMCKYGVTHRLSTAYHPQASGQVEVSNRGLKRILERTIGQNHASWSDKLDDALWAFRTAYKTPIGCTPYKLVYGKACHLPMELEHKAY